MLLLYQDIFILFFVAKPLFLGLSEVHYHFAGVPVLKRFGRI